MAHSSHRYQSQTIRSYNSDRYVYLPLFPTGSSVTRKYVLLANVPASRLSSHEMKQRRDAGHTAEAQVVLQHYDYFSPFSISRRDIDVLANRLLMEPPILLFNADRLRNYCAYFLKLYDRFRRRILCSSVPSGRETALDSSQMVLLLEFYLQMDVDLFYMKTCCFRGAWPRSAFDGLFCGDDEPQASYKLSPCTQPSCRCCHPLNADRRSQPWPVISFGTSSAHRFLNGYTTYLNCPATCTTSNLVYAMTCLCGDYDYVDSTARTLSDAMTCLSHASVGREIAVMSFDVDHRDQANRIIHEWLTGSPVCRSWMPTYSINELERAKKMRLYQHAARCPSVLRVFLDCNPQYWCFIPRPCNETMMNHFNCLGEPLERASEMDHLVQSGVIDDRRLVRFLEHVPLPPAGFMFSYQDRQQQRFFFRHLLSIHHDQIPFIPLDLYKVSIVAVLPDDRSSLLRYMIETLFIVHAETKLNMICPVGGSSRHLYGRAYNLSWCRDLDHPPTSIIQPSASRPDMTTLL